MRCGRTRNSTTTAAATGATRRANGDRNEALATFPFPVSAYCRATLDPPQEPKRDEGRDREHGRLDVGQAHVAVQLGHENLRREHPLTAAKDVRRAERPE